MTRSHRRILLVEDNPAEILLARRALALHGVAEEVVVSATGVEALEWLWSSKPGSEAPALRAPALVLLDLNLADMDGHEVLRQLRSDPRTQATPIVVLTTSNEPNDIQRSYALGANGYVCKPLDFDRFSYAIRDILAFWLRWNEVDSTGGNRS